MKTLEQRLEEKYMPEPNSGCWLWIGALNTNGYGSIGVGKRIKTAHRVTYELYKGPVIDGMELDHLCRIRCCVNPDHLEPVDRKENMRRSTISETYGRFNRRKTNCPHGHPYSGENLYIDAVGDRHCRACNRNRQRIMRNGACA